MKKISGITKCGIILLITSVLITSCGQSNSNITNTDIQEATTATISQDMPTTINTDNVIGDAIDTDSDNTIAGSGENNDTLDQKQLNSANMLNYLTVLSTEITNSKNSRLFLEQTYDELINNTSPNVDEETEDQLITFLEILKDLKMNEQQRERTEYIYEQNCAQALKAAIPNPIGLLSAVESKSLVKIAASVAYMAIDSYSSYTSYKSSAELEKLKQTWKLDDNETNYIHENRSSTFRYMIEITRKYNLPDEVTLTENDVEYFVKWRNNNNVESRIQALETTDSIEKYEHFGPYWLLLASSYFQHGDYEKTLTAMEEYKKLNNTIFRKDYEYAQTLPVVIAAAEQVLKDDKYVESMESYISEIIKNTNQDDWQLRYFAAQACLNLYAKTNNVDYLQYAYEMTKNNINNLVSYQQAENAIFLEKAETQEKSGFNPIERKKVNDANKKAEAEKNKTLPPICQGLLLNCQLLFSIDDILNISEQEKASVNNILHPDGKPIFLTETLDLLFWFDHKASSGKEEEATMTESTITIPTKYLSENSKIKVTAIGDSKKEVLKKWKVSSGERRKDNDINSFTTTYQSSAAKKFDYSDIEKIEIYIVPDKDTNIEGKTVKFSVSESKKLIQNPLDKEYEFKRIK